MKTSVILLTFATIMLLGPFLFGGLGNAPTLALTLVVAATLACALMTSRLVSSRWLHAAGLFGGVVVTLASSLYFAKLAIAAHDLSLRQQPPFAKLIAEHNAGLPEDYPTRIDPGTSQGFSGGGPAAIYGLIAFGMLLMRALTGRETAAGAPAATT